MNLQNNGLAQFLCAFLVAAAGFGSILVADPRKPDAAQFGIEVSPNGSAIFFQQHGPQKSVLWTVTCQTPFRDCTARADVVRLQLNNKNEPWLDAPIAGGSRISIQEKNYTTDVPDLFSKPLSRSLIHRLAQPKTFLVVENNEHLLFRESLAQLDRVIAYLGELPQADTRSFNAAAPIPAQETLDHAPVPATVLERFQIMQQRRSQPQRQMVPINKPQAEMAIRSQGGASFFRDDGRAGY